MSDREPDRETEPWSDPTTEPGWAGRVLVVTGAAGDIGAACVARALGRGASVVASDRGADLLRERWGRSGDSLLLVPADLTDPRNCRELGERAANWRGPIAGGVFAAGHVEHVGFADMTTRQWEDMVTVHLSSTAHLLRSLLAHISTGASFVCVGSTVAHHGGVVGQAHYVSAKAGLLGLVRACARELGPRGVRVNMVSPGFTLTGATRALFDDDEIRARARRAPLGRLPGPADIAAVVAFLLDDESALVTGEEIRVDSGARLA